MDEQENDKREPENKDESSYAEASEDRITIEETVDEAGNLDFQEKLKQLQEKLKKCGELKDEYLNGWQRAKADLINARKDDEKRNQEFLKFANASLIIEILPVLDSFDLAFIGEEPSFAKASAGKQDAKFSKGVFLIKMQLEDILRKYGFEPVKSVGEKVNLQLHEIVQEVESDKEDGIIVEEIQKGYMLYGKVLRPARVKISKSKK